MNFLLTLLLTLVLVALVLWFFVRIGSPVYRVERVNVVRLLELVIAGEATNSDWGVFVGMPIRHDPVLDEIRQRCNDIGERELSGGDRMRLTKKGIAELQDILDELKKESERTLK